MKGLRGTAFDPFGYSAERRMERRLIEDYRAVIDRIAGDLDAFNLPAAVEVAAAAGRIAGYGPKLTKRSSPRSSMHLSRPGLRSARPDALCRALEARTG